MGAAPGQLVGMVLLQALRLILVGVGLGVGIALATASWISPLLFNVSARDPLVLGGVALVLVVVAIVAAVVPAWRVTRIDPNLAFRSD